MMTKYKFLCADIGTSSLKAALVLENGQVLSFSKVEFSSTDNFKIALQWIVALKKAIAEIKFNLQINGTLDCDALCISGNGPTIIAEDGTTLLWNEPLSFVPQVPEEYKNSLFIPRLIAFKNLYKEKVKSQKIFCGPEYLIYKLCGKQISVLPEERFKSAYWDNDALFAIGINPASIGKFVNPGFNCGTIFSELANELCLSPKTKIISGAPDFVVALIGTNTLEPGKLCNRAGTSEGLNWCTSKPVFAKNVRTLPSIIPGLWNVSVLLTSSGKQIAKDKHDYEKENNTLISYKDFIDLCFKNPSLAGSKTLITLSDFFSSAITTLRQLAKENNLPINDTVMITGGQAKNSQWILHKAKVSKINFGVTEIADSELIGDAVLAAVGLEVYDSIKEASEKMVKINSHFDWQKG